MLNFEKAFVGDTREEGVAVIVSVVQLEEIIIHTLSSPGRG